MISVWSLKVSTLESTSGFYQSITDLVNDSRYVGFQLVKLKRSQATDRAITGWFMKKRLDVVCRWVYVGVSIDGHTPNGWFVVENLTEME